MKKPIIIALFFSILGAITSLGQGVWIEQTVDTDTELRTGVIEINGETYEIKPGANLIGADLSGADLSGVILIAANLNEANLSGAKLEGPSSVDLISKGQA